MNDLALKAAKQVASGQGGDDSEGRHPEIWPWRFGLASIHWIGPENYCNHFLLGGTLFWDKNQMQIISYFSVSIKIHNSSGWKHILDSEFLWLETI